MKSSRFFTVTAITGLLFLITSCSSNDDSIPEAPRTTEAIEEDS